MLDVYAHTPFHNRQHLKRLHQCNFEGCMSRLQRFILTYSAENTGLCSFFSPDSDAYTVVQSSGLTPRLSNQRAKPYRSRQTKQPRSKITVCVEDTHLVT